MSPETRMHPDTPPAGADVLYRFAGDFAATPVERLTEEVRTLLAHAAVPARTRSRLFASFVEMVQNVIHYGAPDPRPGGARRGGTIELGRDADGYWVRCANPVRSEHAERLRARLEALRSMQPPEIVAAYRARLDAPAERATDPLSRGAGLGLLSIARNASAPLQYALRGGDGSPLTFALRATLAPSPEASR